MCDKEHGIDCKPGRVALFEHEIQHRGGKVIEGEKYAIRCDILYSKNEKYK